MILCGKKIIKINCACEKPMVFVEENLSTAVFMTVAGAAVIWPAQGVKLGQANIGDAIPAALRTAMLW